MAGALGSLIVRLSLEHAAYTKGLDKSSQDVLKYGKTVQDAVDSAGRSMRNFLGGVVSGAVAAVASYQSVSAVVEGVANAINRLDEISKTASRFGVAAETLEELAIAAELSDVSLEGLATGIKKLSEGMVEAANGSKEQAALFKAMGIEVKNADGSMRASSDVMGEIADEFANMADGAVKTTLAVKLFGKSGADMIPLLNGGAAGLKSAAEEARNFGLVLSQETLKKAEAFNDNLTRLGKVSQGVFTQIAASALPVLVDLTDELVKAATGAGSLTEGVQDLSKSTDLLDFMEAGALAASTLAESLILVGKTARAIGGSFQAAGADVLALGTIATASRSDWVEYIRDGTGDIKRALDAREAIVAEANARYADLWNYNGQFISDAIRKSFDKQRKALAAGNAEIDRELARFDRAAASAKEIAKRWREERYNFDKAGDEEKRANEELAQIFGKMVDAGDALIRSTKDRTDLMMEEIKLGRELTDTEKALFELRQKTRDQTVSMTATKETEYKEALEFNEALKTYRQLQKDAAAADAAEIKAIDQRTQAYGAEAAKLEEQIATFGMTEDAVSRLEVARLRETAAAKAQLASVYLLSGASADLIVKTYEEAAALTNLADAREGLANKKYNAQIEADAKAWRDEWERTNQSIADGLASALMEGGRSARDYLKQIFKQLVLQPIVRAALEPFTGGLTGLAMAASGAGTGGAAGGGALGGLNNASTLVNLYQGLTGFSSSVSTLATMFGAGATAGASSISLAYANAVGATGGDALGALIASNGSWSGVAAGGTAGGTTAGVGGSAAGGTAMSVLGWAAFAYAAAKYGEKLYNEGFRGSEQIDDKGWYENTFERYKTDSLKAIGISDKWAEILGGSVRLNHMFGHAAPRITEAGVSGTLTGGGFSGQAYADILEKGGLFRSDRRRTEYADLEQGIDEFFDDAAAAVFQKAKEFGEALGLPAEALANVTSEIKVALTDDVEKNKEEIIKALASYGDALVSGFADKVAPFKAYGETTAQTIERLGAAIVSVNTTLEGLGLMQLGKSLGGAEAAIDLQGLFGGQDQFEQLAASFYGAFYSEAEKTQSLGAQLAETFEDLGLSMPSLAGGADEAKAAYRELVRAQDLSTESGREAFAALLGLSSVFDAVAQASDALAKAEEERMAAVASQSGDLQIELLRAQGREQEAVNLERQRELAQLSALEESLNVAAGTFTDVQESIYSAVDANDALAKAAEAAADAQSKLASVVSGQDAAAASFLGGLDLQAYLADRIRGELLAGGLDAPLQNILASTREDVLALYQSLGIDGKQVILDTLPLWEQLQEVMADIAIEGVASSVDELLAAYREINPAADNLVDSWRKNKDEMTALGDALDEINGTKALSAIDQLRALVEKRDQLADVIADNVEQISQISGSRQDQSGVDFLKSREAALWQQYASTGNPEVARAISKITLDRIKLEGTLQQKALQEQYDARYQAELEVFNLQKASYEAAKDAAQEQIDSAKRMIELAKELPNTLASFRAGSLSNLSYTGRLEQQQQLFRASLVTGEDAQGQLTAYLQQAQQMYGGATAQYSAIFEQALAEYQAAIQEGAANADTTMATAEAQLRALEELAPKLETAIVDTSDAQIAALDSMNLVFDGKLTDLNAEAVKQTEYQRQQLEKQRLMLEALEAQISQHAAGYQELIGNQRQMLDNQQRTTGQRDLEQVLAT